MSTIELMNDTVTRCVESLDHQVYEIRERILKGGT